jgi:hypothetical protein
MLTVLIRLIHLMIVTLIVIFTSQPGLDWLQLEFDHRLRTHPTKTTVAAIAVSAGPNK